VLPRINLHNPNEINVQFLVILEAKIVIHFFVMIRDLFEEVAE
jgi:hypothetical protein